MPGRRIRIARIAGIPVGVSPWWLAIVALITWTLGSAYFPEVVPGLSSAEAYGLGLASALLLFASILAHEFGHALVARRHGIAVREIDLWLLGGVSVMGGEAHRPEDELRYALAGPATTAAIAACFGIAFALLPAGTPAVLGALVEYQLLVNCMILGFNLLPAFPLDGGRVLRAVLWRRRGAIGPATERAAAVGRVFGYVLIGLGALEAVNGYPEGLWLVLVGSFVIAAARGETLGVQLRSTFAGVPVSAVMSRPAVTIPADASLQRAIDDYFVRYGFVAFPVVEHGSRLVGLLTLARVRRVPARQRQQTLAADVADRDPQLAVAAETEIPALLETPAFVRLGRAVIVDADGVSQGLLSASDIERALRARQLRDGAGRPRAGQSALG